MKQINYYTGSQKPELMYQRAYGTGSLVIESEYYNTTKMSPSELIKEFFGYPIQTAYSLAGNLINWKLYGNSVQRLLPEGYTQLESIGSDSKAYINTGIAGGKTTLEIGVKFSYSSYVEYGGIYGNYVADANQGIRCILANNSSSIITNNETICATSGNTELNCSINDVHTLISKNTEVVLDGVTYTITNKAQGTENSGNIALCNRSITNPNTSRDIGLQVNEFYIKDNDVLVCNLIPAKRNSDNAVGMYDLVTNTFKPNAGTGSFVAGAEAPTPTSPIEIKSVGDKTKNLFDYTKIANNTKAGITLTKINGGFTLSGTATGYSTFEAYLDNPISKAGEPIYLSYLSSGSTTGDYGFRVRNKDSGEFLAVSNNRSYTPTFDVDYIQVYTTNTGTFDITVTDIQIVKGSTATSYVPYGYQIPVAVGSNCGFVDLGTLTWSNRLGNGLWVTVGTFAPKYPAKAFGITNIYSPNYDVTNKDVSSMPEGTITGASSNQLIYIKDSSYTDVTSFQQALSGKYLYYQRTTDTEFTPPTTKTIYLSNPLRKVGTYADYIDYENQQVVRNVGVKVLDGTESWTKQEYATDNIGFRLRITDRVQLKDEVICSHYQYSNLTSTNAPNNSIVTFTSTNVDIKDNGFATADDFKAFLADQYANGTPVIIEYQLATPVTEPLTVPALTLAEGSNHITAETATSPVDMYAKGYVSEL